MECCSVPFRSIETKTVLLYYDGMSGIAFILQSWNQNTIKFVGGFNNIG